VCVFSQASSRVEAYLPRGVWTLVGRVHDAHGAVASVVAAVTVTVAAEAERGGEGRRRRLMHAEGGVGVAAGGGGGGALPRRGSGREWKRRRLGAWGTACSRRAIGLHVEGTTAFLNDD
jgi:hypothetical protein